MDFYIYYNKKRNTSIHISAEGVICVHGNHATVDDMLGALKEWNQAMENTQ